jgi:hypothetical protein
MEIRSALVHIASAASIGGLISAFTPAMWLAAALWVSAAMLVTGAVATVEDMTPGGFDNPDGCNTSKGVGVLALMCVAAAFALCGLGFAVQFVWL